MTHNKHKDKREKVNRTMPARPPATRPICPHCRQELTEFWDGDQTRWGCYNAYCPTANVRTK